MKVTADNIIAEVLSGKQGAAQIFMSYGSHCLTCNNVNFKRVADMAQKHQADLETLLNQLNDLPDA